MNRFDRLYNMIMEDKTLEVNNKIFDYIDNGQNFDDLTYQEQRLIVLTMDLNVKVYGEEAKGLYLNVHQFDLFTLLLEFGDEWEKYKDDDWSYENSKQYAKRLKERIESDSFLFPANDFAYFSTKENVLKTWQDVADEVWSYYEV